MSDPVEDLLREVVTGERAESDLEVQRALRDPELRARLQRLRELSARLDAAGALQRDVLATPPSAASAALPTIDIGAVRQHARRRTRAGLLAAAMLVLGVGALLWWNSRDSAAPSAPRDTRLGPGEWELTREVAPAPFGLRWQDPEGPLRPGQRYEVRVFAHAAQTDPVATFRAGKSSTWTPTEAELQSLPDPFWYEVDVIGLAGLQRRSKLSGPMRR